MPKGYKDYLEVIRRSPRCYRSGKLSRNKSSTKPLFNTLLLYRRRPLFIMAAD